MIDAPEVAEITSDRAHSPDGADPRAGHCMLGCEHGGVRSAAWRRDLSRRYHIEFQLNWSHRPTSPARWLLFPVQRGPKRSTGGCAVACGQNAFFRIKPGSVAGSRPGLLGFPNGLTGAGARASRIDVNLAAFVRW